MVFCSAQKITKGVAGWWIVLALLGGLLSLKLPGTLVLLFTAGLIICVLWKYRKFSLILACAVLISAGAGYARVRPYQPEHNPLNIAHLIGQSEQQYRLLVTSAPQKNSKNLVSFAGTIRTAEKSYFGKVWVSGYFDRLPKYGEEIIITGQVEASLYHKNYAAAVSFPEVIEILPGKLSLPRMLLTLREKTIAHLNARIAEPYASLLSGLLLGNRSGFSGEIKQSLSQVGLAHIVVVSGMHLLIIVGTMQKICSRVLSRFWTALFLLSLTLAFVLFSGSASSTIRAGLMTALLIILPLYNRLRNPTRVLVVTAALAFLVNPYLQSDLGFQLSFVATAGILYWRKQIEKFLKFIPNFLQIRTILSLTGAAQIAVIPLLLLNFHIFPWITPLSNLIVAPLVPYLMLNGFLLIVVPGFLVNLLQISATLLSYPVLKLANWGAQAPIGNYAVSLSLTLALYGVFGLIIYFSGQHPQRQWRKERRRLIKVQTT